MSSFYCQLDYEHVPYLSPVGAVNGNIANNGCGVCSAAMVAENMLGVSFPPEAAARLAKMCGARETWGTNLYIFAPMFAAHLGMTVRDTEDADEALRFLQEKRGMVIANTQGDREQDGYIGVFSNGGHYIVIAEAEGTTVKVWDPMYKEGSGRFDIPGRKGKVRLDGTDAYADMSVLKEDCKDRPFFLFEKQNTPAPAPLIGITGTKDEQGRLSIPGDYSQAVLNAGGVPVVFDPDMEADKLHDCILHIDGLLAAGICPQTALSETEAIRMCREMNKPVLGTGHGMHLMIRALGGQADSDQENPGECSGVCAVRGTRLEVIAGGEYPVNDCCAGTVSAIPEEMRVCATAPDGAITAVERRENALFLGVSWHPERVYSRDANADALFVALVESARV